MIYMFILIVMGWLGIIFYAIGLPKIAESAHEKAELLTRERSDKFKKYVIGNFIIILALVSILRVIW